MQKNLARAALFGALLALLAGCALKPKYLAPGYAPPQKIAVLPMANQSNDLKGAEVVRQEFFLKIRDRGYELISMQETDDLLRTKFGITDGGQLNSTTTQKLGEALNVDGVIYGDLLKFQFLNVGFYQQKVVEANFKLVDVKSGQPLWEDQRKAIGGIKVETVPKEAAKAFGRGLAEKAVENILQIPLYEQVQQVVRRAVATLPSAR